MITQILANIACFVPPIFAMCLFGYWVENTDLGARFASRAARILHMDFDPLWR